MKNFIFLILGSSITFIGTIISFLEKSKDNKKDEKSNFYNVGSLLIVVLGILITAYSGYDSLNEKQISDRQKHLSDSIALEYQHSLLEKSNYIIETQEQNQAETKKLNDSLSNAKSSFIGLQQETINQITGGNSFPYAWFPFILDSQVIIKIENKGKYPIYDLTMLVRDVDVYNTKDKKLIYETMKEERQISIGNLGIGKAYSATLNLVLKGSERNIKIQYTSKSEDYFQWIKLRWNNSNLKTATKVEQIIGNKNKKVFEKIDTGFLNKNEKFTPWVDHWFK